MAALVTGGGSGIGLACARRLALDGASVTICGRTEERLRAAAASIDASGAEAGTEKVEVVPTDVTDEAAVVRAVTAATERTGRLDAVVISAGGSETIGPITQIDVEAWRRTVDLNLTAAMATIKHSARVMTTQGGGSIVAISSIAATATHRWFGAYGPAKAGLEMLCMMAADELGPSGVRVNAVRPSLTRTELVELFTQPGPMRDDYLSCMPLARVGEPEEVAALVRFLVGPESSWITGQNVGIDGGHSLRRGPDVSSMLLEAFGSDGLRGVVGDGG